MPDPLTIFGLPLVLALICFVALWPLSLRWKDVSVVDVLWGPGFIGQMAVVGFLLPEIYLHGWIVFVLVAIWSVRLSLVILRRWARHRGEDARYQMIRKSWGASFWWKSIFIVFVLQAFIQWAIVIGPVAVLASEQSTLGLLAWTGVFAACAGLILEAVADQQLDTFKQTAGQDDLCTNGLRAHVRHPNYSGEIVFWIGIALIAVDAGAWLGLISPLLLTVFLTRVSGAPLIDERLEATRPAYPAYRARVPGFIPWVGTKAGEIGTRR